jgi:hypothetical protein
LAWGSGSWESRRVYAAGISADGELLNQTPLTLSGLPYAQCEDGETELRNVASTWTGEHFIVMWNTFMCPPIKKRHPPVVEPPGAVMVPDWDSYPIQAQWLTVDRTPLFEDPILISQTSTPWECGLHYTNDRYLAFIHDGATNHYIHSLILDEDGQTAEPPSRYRTPVDFHHPCNIFECSGEWFRGMVVRPWLVNAAVFYSRHYYFFGYVGTHIEEVDIYIDRIAPNGTHLSRYRIAVDHSVPVSEPRSYDFAAGEGSFLLAYGAAGGDAPIPYIRAKLVGDDGSSLYTWHVVSDSAASNPAVAKLADGYLMVWLEGSTLPQLTIAHLDPSDPEYEVSGATLLNSFGVQGSPHLVPGPEQVLLVFPAKLEPDGLPSPSGYDIYAMRFDMEGEAIDAYPIPLYTLPGDQGNVQGIWDSNQYLVTWRNTDNYQGTLFGGRIGDNGAIIDTSGFTIADAISGFGRLTSDPVGNVAVAYNGQYVRLIEDVIPLLDEDDWPGDDTLPDDPDTVVSAAVHFGVVAPNPCIGEVHLDLSMPPGIDAEVVVLDCLGREIAKRRVRSGDTEYAVVWNGIMDDGRRAPTGFYLLRIRAGNREVRRNVILLH